MLEPLEKNSLNASHAYHNAYQYNAESNSDAVKDPYDAMWNDSSSDDSGIFGLPFTVEESSLVIVPVPCDVACSQAMGTANAPDLILRESRYVELHDVVLGNIYERRIAMKPVAIELSALLARMSELEADQQSSSLNLDPLCSEMNTVIENIVDCELKAGRATGLLGGDHSVSYGSIAAHRHAFPDLGILQIDAHADLRPSLDGMVWSHASVMYHVMENLEPVSLTQVGVRAICSVERAYQESNERITSYTDHELQMQLAGGKSWLSVCDQIVASLPNEIYLSLDIDGLDPVCCPRTGTPVSGGLSFIQVSQLLHRIVESGRTIRGFDLVEVGADQYDALVAAHLLYLLCGLVENRLKSS